MRSAEEIRAEIERLREVMVKCRYRSSLLWPFAVSARIDALEWVLADEQKEPKEIKKCPSLLA
jgi:hypothetical protein